MLSCKEKIWQEDEVKLLIVCEVMLAELVLQSESRKLLFLWK